jgi:hypothetical protein
MTVDEFESLRVGDAVLVHHVPFVPLRPGVVVSAGRFDARRPGVHAGIKLLATGAIVYPTWERVHRHPLDASEPCRFCASERFS